ncbi:hypothetical protein MCAMS1_02079 [biofilm metagenome]
MLPRLPKEIDAFEWADRNASIKGELEVSKFDRLSEFLFDDSGKAALEVTFGKKGRLTVIEGHIAATLALKCQRCLEAIHWHIDTNINLGVVGSLEQINKLPEGFEPLLLADDGLLQLKTLIEDELLLYLPDIPKHQYECPIPLIKKDRIGILPEDNTKKVNPFSVLADLKNLEIKNGSTKK